MFKNVHHGKEGREKIKKGVDETANAVKVTLGAGGRNVIIGNGYGPIHLTKDGVTVAKSISYVDPLENMGATLIKEVALKTVAEAGDGTTTSTILAQAIINLGMEAIDNGANPVELKKGIESATKKVVEKLKELSRPISVEDHEKLIQIATISANNDVEIGKLIADAYAEVGKDGQIDISDSKTHETTVEVVSGMQIDRGYHSPIFINNDRKRICELENPLILVSDVKLSTIPQILPFFETVFKTNPTTPILLIVDRLEGEALSFIYKNKMDRKINITVILAPGFGESRKRELEDIAISTGGTFISDEQGMTIAKATIKDCGGAEKVVVDEKNTLFISGKGNYVDVENRIVAIKAELEEAQIKDKLKVRLTRMIGKMASIKVGAMSQTEALEKKDRIDDALCATRAATEEGYVSGGGTAYLHCGDASLDETSFGHGENIIYAAIKEPFNQILSNAGIEDKLQILDKLGSYGNGYNVKTEKVEDLFESGVIDPTKVCRCALENAASVAGIFLTTECVVSDPKPKDY